MSPLPLSGAVFEEFSNESLMLNGVSHVAVNVCLVREAKVPSLRVSVHHNSTIPKWTESKPNGSVCFSYRIWDHHTFPFNMKKWGGEGGGLKDKMEMKRGMEGGDGEGRGETAHRGKAGKA